MKYQKIKDSTTKSSLLLNHVWGLPFLSKNSGVKIDFWAVLGPFSQSFSPIICNSSTLSILMSGPLLDFYQGNQGLFDKISTPLGPCLWFFPFCTEILELNSGHFSEHFPILVQDSRSGPFLDLSASTAWLCSGV